MAKVIKYQLCTRGESGTEILTDVTMGWNETNEAIAAAEAYNGKYTVEDDGSVATVQPSQLDIIEAQVTYTAMMTDTLLEV